MQFARKINIYFRFCTLTMSTIRHYKVMNCKYGAGTSTIGDCDTANQHQSTSFPQTLECNHPKMHLVVELLIVSVFGSPRKETKNKFEFKEMDGGFPCDSHLLRFLSLKHVHKQRLLSSSWSPPLLLFSVEIGKEEKNTQKVGTF